MFLRIWVVEGEMRGVWCLLMPVVAVCCSVLQHVAVKRAAISDF